MKFFLLILATSAILVYFDIPANISGPIMLAVGIFAGVQSVK